MNHSPLLISCSVVLGQAATGALAAAGVEVDRVSAEARTAFTALLALNDRGTAPEKAAQVTVWSAASVAEEVAVAAREECQLVWDTAKAAADAAAAVVRPCRTLGRY